MAARLRVVTLQRCSAGKRLTAWLAGISYLACAPLIIENTDIKHSMSPYASSHAVPEVHRLFTQRDAFALWFSLGMGLLVAQLGAMVGTDLAFPLALATIVAGSLLGAFLLAAAGTIGTDTGLAAMASMRLTLGRHGALVPSLFNVVQLIGWGSFEIVVMRDSFDTLARHYLAVSFPVAFALLAGFAATLVAVMGPLSFVRRFLSIWGVRLLLMTALWLSYKLLTRQNLHVLWLHGGAGLAHCGMALDLLFANALSWLPLISDYTRFGRQARQMFRGTLWGYGIASLWFYTLGAAFIASAGEGAALMSALLSAGSGLALFVILLGETDNAFADIHSAAVSTGMFARRTSVRLLSLLIGLSCIGIALFTPLARYESFLLLIGSVFAPLFGVVLTDHFIIRHRAMPADGATGRWHWRAFLAWAAGILMYQLIHTNWAYLGATLPSLVFGGLCYWLLARLQGAPRLTGKTCSASARTDA